MGVGGGGVGGGGGGEVCGVCARVRVCVRVLRGGCILIGASLAQAHASLLCLTLHLHLL